MTDEEKHRRGKHAEALLGNELFRDALAAVERDCLEEVAGSRPQDRDAREAAYFRLRGAQAVRARLESWATDARMIESRNRTRP